MLESEFDDYDPVFGDHTLFTSGDIANTDTYMPHEVGKLSSYNVIWTMSQNVDETLAEEPQFLEYYVVLGMMVLTMTAVWMEKKYGQTKDLFTNNFLKGELFNTSEVRPVPAINNAQDFQDYHKYNIAINKPLPTPQTPDQSAH